MAKWLSVFWTPLSPQGTHEYKYKGTTLVLHPKHITLCCMLFNILLYLKDPWERQGWLNCSLVPLPLPSPFHFAFYKLTSPLNPFQSLMPILSWCYGEDWSWKIRLSLPWLQGWAVFFSNPRILLPLQGWVGGAGRASGQLTVTRPHDGEPPPGSRRLKTETNIFNAVTTHAGRLCCQEAWYLTASRCLVPCWRAKCLNASEMSPASPFSRLQDAASCLSSSSH